MGDVVKKMCNEAPKALLWFYIFLAADVAVSPVDLNITIQANFIFSLAGM